MAIIKANLDVSQPTGSGGSSIARNGDMISTADATMSCVTGLTYLPFEPFGAVMAACKYLPIGLAIA